MKIVMVVSSLKCFKNFLNYYNNSNEDFIFLVDTRYNSNQEIINVILDQKVIEKYQIVLSNQLFDNVKEYLSFKEESVARKIFYFHPVAIKFLIFPYLVHVLKIEKFFLIDDDVYILEPILKYFEKDYAVYYESLTSVNSTQKKYLDLIFEGIKINEQKTNINSGTMVYTYKKEHNLEKYISNFFTRELLDFFYEKEIDLGIYAGVIRSNVTFTIEQIFFGYFFEIIKEEKQNLKTPHIKAIWSLDGSKSKLKKDPAIIHYCLKDKVSAISYFNRRINKVSSHLYI
jgi:hypothetical protein